MLTFGENGFCAPAVSVVANRMTAKKLFSYSLIVKILQFREQRYKNLPKAPNFHTKDLHYAGKYHGNSINFRIFASVFYYKPSDYENSDTRRLDLFFAHIATDLNSEEKIS